MTSSHLPAYQALVLYYRRGPQVRDTLDALAAQSLVPTATVLIDNDSADGVAHSFRDRCDVVALENNIGYGPAMNRGVSSRPLDSKYLLFLTHEVILEPGCVEELVRVAEEEGAAAVGPSLSLPTGDAWSNGGTFTRCGAARHVAPGPSNVASPVRWLDGAVLLVLRDAFEAVGGFQENFFLYWEDVDIGLRLRAIGPVLAVPTARAVQETGMTPPYWNARNRIMCWKLHRNWRLLFLSVAALWRSASEAALRRRDPALARTILSGVLDGLLGRINVTAGSVRPRSAHE